MSEPDIRDEIFWSARALRGLADLINEAARDGEGFETLGAVELGELVNMLVTRLEVASDLLQDCPITR